MARTTSASTAGPIPAAWERIMERWEDSPPIGGNRLRSQGPEAGGDTVNGVALRQVFDDAARYGHPLDGGIAQMHVLPPARNRDNIGDGYAGTFEFHTHERTGFSPATCGGSMDTRNRREPHQKPGDWFCGGQISFERNALWVVDSLYPPSV